MNVVADYFYRARGAGHTRLLIRSVAHYLMESQGEIIVFVGSMREADDIRKAVRDTLLNDVRKVSYAVKATERIVFVSARERNQDSKICGRRVPALVDNAAVMEITEGYQRQLGAMANSIEDRDEETKKLVRELKAEKQRAHKYWRELIKRDALALHAEAYRKAAIAHEQYEAPLETRDRNVEDITEEEDAENYRLWRAAYDAEHALLNYIRSKDGFR